MKYLYVLSVFLTLGFTLVNEQDPNNKNKDFFNKYGYSTLKGDYLFMYQTEITNGQYLEYTYWTYKTKGDAAYRATLPDTQVWQNNLTANESMVTHYFRHTAYRDYPLVGISYRQAQAYCNWAAERMMEGPDFKKLNIEKIIMRLPSEAEWMQAARGSLPQTVMWPWDGNTIRMEGGKKKDEGKIRLNIKMEEHKGIIGCEYVDAGFITTPVYSYWPNTIGIYNMCGNVAEWVEEKKARGGSWNDLPYYARIDFNAPVRSDSFRSSTIGFRPVLEVVSYKSSSRSKLLQVNATMLDRSVVKVNDSIYAAIFETDNLLYNTFLSENQGQGFENNNNKWMDYTRYKQMEQYAWLPKYDFYPAVNMGYESSIKFCEWLTLKYNSSAKRTYKKVVFKLPSELEWTLASMGGKQHFYYPWGGAYTRNSRGAYLANFSPLEEQYLSKGVDPASVKKDYADYYKYPNDDFSISRGVDGLEFTGPVKSYFPNALGLYNCSGNVAEMLQEKSVSKGGSWTSSQYSITVAAHETYKGPDANLGFRYFMEIVEK